tara:strand:+ start:1336 stop:2214 length:879 start_codon:yes stop_codon:yes gene_type:complete
MTSIPKNIDSTNLTDNEIRAYYSLTQKDDFHSQRMSMIIKDYMDKKMKFKTDNAKRSFKKRLVGWIKEAPDNSRVYDAFNSWRISQINLHISKQRKYRLEEEVQSPRSNDKQKILELEEQLKLKDDIIKKLTEQLKKSDMVDEVLDEAFDSVSVSVALRPTLSVSSEVSEVFEEPSGSVYGEELVEVVKADEPKEEVEPKTTYESCEDKAEAIELYYKKANKKAYELESQLTGDNKSELLESFEEWAEEEVGDLDDTHEISNIWINEEPSEWSTLTNKPYQLFNDRLKDLTY